MLRIDVITIHPELLASPFAHSMMQRAQDRNLLLIELHDLKDFGIGKYRQVDDTAYGGGAGMVMMAAPLVAAIESLTTQRSYDEIIYMSPDGDTFNQKTANYLSLQSNLIIICGHYKGIDERVREHWITKEISIGDYVLSGGELPAAVLVDAIGRLIPGVLNDESSALSDSFQDDLLAPPVYTRPANFRGYEVPEILRSGHKAKIDSWNYEQSLKRTQERRPDLFREDETD
jgi:tRNA (guanine37-N1)-methyltransferase